MHLICDNGYLCWPTTICPFKCAETGTSEDYFSTHLEGIWKDVECTFEILKKRWRILNKGFYHHDIRICKKIFITCCWMNNFMLDVMERTNVRVGRGAPLGFDGIWLSGTTEIEPEAAEENDWDLSVQFLHRQSLLVNHFHVFCIKGPIPN